MPRTLLSRLYPMEPGSPEPVLAVQDVLRELPAANPDFVLCVVEAVANAVRHSQGTEVRVEITDHGRGSYACVVQDNGTGYDFREVLERGLPEDPFQEHGRGIHIIRSLAGHLELTDGGRHVAFRVDSPAGESR